MESESAIHGKKGAVDHGKYIPSPLVQGLMVADGQRLRKVYVLSTGNIPDNSQSLSNGMVSVPFNETELPAGFVVGADAFLDVVVIVLPGVSARLPITIDLIGEHSEVSLAGIFISSGSDEVTFDITVNHRAGGCSSRQLFNGLASGEAKCAFFGKIVVAPDAQKTEAYQENHNILLSAQARVNTKPRLEIYADDVKCSHGATVGQLNEEELFYMRSRGIPLDEAKALQMISFVAPVLAHIPETSFDSPGSGSCRQIEDNSSARRPEESRAAVTALVENAIRSIA